MGVYWGAPLCRCRMQLCPLCNLAGGHYCICNNVRRTVLHRQSCPPWRWCIMQCVRPDTFVCSWVVSAPVRNRPCSKLNALNRRTTFAIFFYKLLVHVMNDMGNVRSFMLAYARTYMYMSAGRFLHSPGHDRMCKSVRSGQYCMADTIASDTGHTCRLWVSRMFKMRSTHPWQNSGETLLFW